MSYTSGKLINPSSDLPYQLLDTVKATNERMGFSKAVGSFQFIDVLGFKMGGSPRIENCTITIPNQSYSATFGVSSNWDLVGYFPVSDIDITSEGIGRSGDGDLGGGWDTDVCGFYLNISPSIILNADKIIIEYDFFTGSTNKHGVGFFPNTSQPSGVYGDTVFGYVGTWDNVSQFRLPTALTSIAYINRKSFSSGTRYTRRVTIKNNIP